MTQKVIGNASLLTPCGRGAVATIAVRGAGVAQHVSPLFRSQSQYGLADAPLGRTLFGRWQASDDDAGEELVVCRTAEQELEIHCHGGSAAVQAIMRRLAEIGYCETSWQASRSRLEAMLAEALTTRTAAILLDQYRGALTKEVNALANAIEAGTEGDSAARLQVLLSRAPIGLHLTQPFRVVLVGEPNVGKSSLVNTLLGFERSIVFDQPGTTRDVVTALTAFDGWPVELSDTAGLRTSFDRIEVAGIAKAQAQLARADLIVWVRDTGSDSPPEVLTPQQSAAALHVLNKCDLLSPSSITHVTSAALLVSAKTGQGIAQLQSAIAARLCPDEPQPGAAVPYLQEQVEQLTAALLALQEAETAQAIQLLRSL